MMSSMTGFAQFVAEVEGGEAAWDLRSLNHRSIDIHLQLPELFRPLEAQCRRILATHLSRGRIDATLTFTTTGAESDDYGIDDSLLDLLLGYSKAVQQRTPDASALSVADILKWPGVIQADPKYDEILSEQVLQLLESATATLTAERQREGALIEDVLWDKLNLFKVGCAQANQLIPEAQQNLKDRFIEKLAELELEVDPGRWEQEIGLALVKLDVAEEIDRINLHVAEFERALQNESVVGKKLGFILQELGREVNTLGSKTSYYPLNSLAVEMKVTLEQMREQIQNVE